MDTKEITFIFIKVDWDNREKFIYRINATSYDDAKDQIKTHLKHDFNWKNDNLIPLKETEFTDIKHLNQKE